MLERLMNDEGQDLIEYALLASIIGVAGLLFMPSIETKMTTAFKAWKEAVWNLWIPNAPA